MRGALLFVFAILAGCSDGANGGAVPEDTGGGGAGDDGVDGTTDAPVDATPTDGTAPDAPASDVPASDAGGCSKPATPGVTNGSISVGGVARTYVLSIPTSYDGKKALPLAFGFHGRTGDGKGFRSYSTVEKAAGTSAIFVYPDGLTVTPSDPKDTGWDLTAKGRDIAFFDALLAKLEGDLCVDSKRVFSFGFSFGGYMSNALGCNRPKVVRAIAPVAGGLAGGTCGGPVAAWLAHATDDGTVAVAEGIKARDLWAKAAGCNLASPTKVAPDPCVTYAGCAAATPVVWCQSATGGHSFPAYVGPGIWQFFAGL